MTPKTTSHLPDWMRDPETDNGRATLTWQFSRWVRSRRAWRAVADRYWSFQSRHRITARYPKITALLGVLAAIAVTVVLYLGVEYLYLLVRMDRGELPR